MSTAHARTTDPQTSHDAASVVNAHSKADKDAPSADVLDSLLVAAKLLTQFPGDFTDKELRARTLPHLRLVHKVECKDDTSRIRCVRKWLSENTLPGDKGPCIVAVEGKRDGERLWKWGNAATPPVQQIQTSMFD